MSNNFALTAKLLQDKRGEILEAWMEAQLANDTLREDIMNKEELRNQSEEFLEAFLMASNSGNMDDINAPEYESINKMLSEISEDRARQGFSPSETATYVFSLKDSLLKFLQANFSDQPDKLNSEVTVVNKLLDKLSMVTFETYSKGREEVISRQQEDMLELSSPVLKAWDGILTLPLIGTLDSARTQVIMENLLTKIVETGAQVAILDISGVPAVDTLVAQHLIKTISAARLMGAECIISGIRPEIAQTIVHLGVDLSTVTTKATKAEALKLAFDMLGLEVAPIDKHKMNTGA